jgi:hypothetical protein
MSSDSAVLWPVSEASSALMWDGVEASKCFECIPDSGEVTCASVMKCCLGSAHEL